MASFIDSVEESLLSEIRVLKEQLSDLETKINDNQNHKYSVYNELRNFSEIVSKLAERIANIESSFDDKSL